MNKYNIYLLTGVTDVADDYDVLKEGIKVSNTNFEVTHLDENEQILDKADCRMNIKLSDYVFHIPWKPSTRNAKSLDGVVVVMDMENAIIEKYAFENAKCKIQGSINDEKTSTELIITADRFILEYQFSTHVFE